MKILHVIPQFPYFGDGTIVGGHASALLTLALAQSKSSLNLTILSSNTEGREGHSTIAEHLDFYSLHGRAKPGTVRFGLQFRKAAADWAASRRGSFDIINYHSGFADYFVASAHLKKKTGLPTIHTLYCPIPGRGSRCRLPIVHGLIKRGAARLDGLCAMSRNVASSMKEYGLPVVEVMGAPVNLERFRPNDDVAGKRRSLGLHEGDVAVLFVGNTKPQKNLWGVVKAFRGVRDHHPNARLVITTELEQSSSATRLAQLRQYIIDSDLESSIIKLGIVDDMPLLMQACDILVAPFLDSYGPSDYFMAVLEAMSCGKPVISSAVGGMPEVITEDHGILINPTNPQEIEQALCRYIADAELRQRCGMSARQFAMQTFDPNIIAERYAHQYARVTA